MLLLCSLLSGILQCADEAVKEIEYLSNGSWRAVGREKDCARTTDHPSLNHSKTCFILKSQFVKCKCFAVFALMVCTIMADYTSFFVFSFLFFSFSLLFWQIFRKLKVLLGFI